MKPTQAESHRAEIAVIVLSTMLEFKKNNEWFSDSRLIDILIHQEEWGFHPHTIRNIRKKLLEEKIIKRDKKQKLPNNEQAYRITSKRNAERLRNWYSKLENRNFETRHLGKYYKRFGMRIKKMLRIKHPRNPILQEFPLKKYIQNICPDCSKKRLGKTKGNSGILDRRCNGCKTTFQFGDDSLVRAIKK